MVTSTQTREALAPQTVQKRHPQSQQQVTPMRLIQMGWAFVMPIAIESAVRTRIFDVLDEHPKTIAQVCQETACSARGVEPLVNFLVAVELLSKSKDGFYSLTPESSAFLVSTKPSFHGGFICHLTADLIPKFLSLSMSSERVIRRAR